MVTADGRRGPVRTWSVLARNRDIRRLFAGGSVSLLGSSVSTVALPLTAAVYLRASPAQTGLLAAAAFLPHLVLGLPAGVWVDRLPYRRVLVLADLAQVLVLGAVPSLAVLGALRVWQLYVVAVLAGTGDLFETVTVQSFTPVLVPRGQLLPANSALMLSNATVNTAGSALGGVLVSLLTAPVAIAADAVSFLLSGLCKARISVCGPDVRAVFSHRIMSAVTVAAAVGALAGQAQNVVLVLYLVRDLRLSSGLVGVVFAVGGAAGVLGALIAVRITRRIGPGPAFIAGMCLAATAGPVLAAAAGPLPLVVGVLVTAQVLRGSGPALYGVNQQTFRQALIPPALLSRANATWRFLVHGTQPAGALLGGLLGSALGLRAALLVSGAAMLLGAAIACASPVRSLREPPGEDGGAVSTSCRRLARSGRSRCRPWRRWRCAGWPCRWCCSRRTRSGPGSGWRRCRRPCRCGR